MSEERRSQSITVSAKTVAEAISEAETRLGLIRDEIDVTVISEGSKGFLGMGGENARILAMPKAILARRAPVEPSRPPARTAAPIKEHEESPARVAPPPLASQLTPAHDPGRQITPVPAVPVAAPVAAAAEPADTAGAEDDDEQPQSVRADPAMVAEVAVEVVRELILRMGLEARATVRSTANPVVVDIMGDDLGLLIGRHGETLSSFQYLVNAIVGKRVHRWCKVVIDVEHYRMRREETLRSLAGRQASRVRQSHQEITLDPMPAAERRVVHMALQNSPWVVTNSVGEEPNRRIVIAPRQSST